MDELTVGDVITGDCVLYDGHRWELSPVSDVRRGTVLTVDAPIFTAHRRRAAAQLGAVVCEMEAASVVACHADVRVLKVVSDRAGAEPDVVIDGARAIAVALFHVRVERLVRTRLLPVLRGA